MANIRISRYILFIFCLIVLSCFTIWWWNSQLNHSDPDQVIFEEPMPPVPANTNTSSTRVADAWQWQTKNNDDSAVKRQAEGDDETENHSGVIDEEFVYRALADVQLDEDGNVIVDPEGLRGLYSTIGYGSLELTSAQMTYLQTTIQNGLPGAAGEQVAKIVDNFYQYLDAKKQLETLYPTLRSPSELRTKLADLDVLREMYLGAEMADALFSEQQAHERYMLANMELSVDDGLSEDEKSEQRAALAERYLNQGPDIIDWDIRHSAFQRDKTAVLDSALSPEEKDDQIQQLYVNQFTSTERNKITKLKLTEF